MVIDCNDGGHPIEVTMKLWAASTVAERQAWREFGQASFLIGNSGSAWFEYSSSQSTLSWNDTSPLDDADLGAALDTHSSVDGYLRGGVYQRRFQLGIALVNPGTAAVTVQLDQSYRTAGGSLVTQVTLAPHSGQVLRMRARWVPSLCITQMPRGVGANPLMALLPARGEAHRRSDRRRARSAPRPRRSPAPASCRRADDRPRRSCDRAGRSTPSGVRAFPPRNSSRPRDGFRQPQT